MPEPVSRKNFSVLITDCNKDGRISREMDKCFRRAGSLKTISFIGNGNILFVTQVSQFSLQQASKIINYFRSKVRVLDTNGDYLFGNVQSYSADERSYTVKLDNGTICTVPLDRIKRTEFQPGRVYLDEAIEDEFNSVRRFFDISDYFETTGEDFGEEIVHFSRLPPELLLPRKDNIQIELLDKAHLFLNPFEYLLQALTIKDFRLNYLEAIKRQCVKVSCALYDLLSQSHTTVQFFEGRLEYYSLLSKALEDYNCCPEIFCPSSFDLYDTLSGIKEDFKAISVQLECVMSANLQEAVSNRQLSELHTHLLGMGAHEFWVNMVVCNFLPLLQIDDRPKDIFQSLCDRLYISKPGHSVSTEKMELALHLKIKFYEQFDQKDEVELTTDVVYSVDILAKALLGYDEDLAETSTLAERQNIVTMIEHYLSNPSVNLNFKDFYKPYIIYSCRKGCFQRILGLPNEYLVGVMEWTKRTTLRSKRAQTIISRVRNCFSMLSVDATAATEHSLDNYRGKFTPSFYPMRYALKDSIYDQNPVVLSYLLNWVCQRYLLAGVGYAEFSVSLNDLANDQIFSFLDPHLVLCGRDVSHAHVHLLMSWRDSMFDLFQYTFLIAVPRNSTVIGCLSASMRRSFVVLAGVKYAELLKVEDSGTTVSRFIEKLFRGKFSVDRIVKNLSKIFLRERNNKCSLVVGVDIVSDENGNPFSPFFHKKVLEVLASFSSLNENFGIRFHGGENVFRSSSSGFDDRISGDTEIGKFLDENFAVHLLVIASEIEKAHSRSFRVRIGHGLAFTAFCDDSSIFDRSVEDVKNLYGYCYQNLLTNLDSWDNICQLLSLLGQLEERCEVNNRLSTDSAKVMVSKTTICAFSLNFRRSLVRIVNEIIIGKGITLEVNTVSNHTLLIDVFCTEIGSNAMESFLISLLMKKFTVRLSTDNDGIWPIVKCKTHFLHISVAFEYCKASKTILHWTHYKCTLEEKLQVYLNLLRYYNSNYGFFCPDNFVVKFRKPSLNGDVRNR
jgi:hypothetical protein